MRIVDLNFFLEFVFVLIETRTLLFFIFQSIPSANS